MQKQTIAGLGFVMLLAVASGGFSQSGGGQANCAGLPTAADLQALLTQAPTKGGHCWRAVQRDTHVGGGREPQWRGLRLC